MTMIQEVTELYSYAKIYHMGHAAISELFADDVVVEEKVDGSQFSFGVIAGELQCRSKGKQLVLDAPEKMFTKAVDTARELEPELKPGWTYRGEYLQKPKHNSLAYDRTPAQHVVLFDINPGREHYLSPQAKADEATRLGLEVVPRLFEGRIESPDELKILLTRVSFLGGAQVEGIVAKNYSRFGRDGKALMGKHVTELFKEVHSKEWKKENKTSKNIILSLVDDYRSLARWMKAAQHLRERGELTNTLKDIGALIDEAKRDIDAECADEIKEKLYQWARPHIVRGSTKGLPQWYKELLLKSQFEDDDQGDGND